MSFSSHYFLSHWRIHCGDWRSSRRLVSCGRGDLTQGELIFRAIPSFCAICVCNSMECFYASIHLLLALRKRVR